MSSVDQRLAELAEMGRRHTEMLTEIRRAVAELLADDVGYPTVAAALGCSRQAVRAQYLNWPYYRQLNRARNSAAAGAVRLGGDR